MKIFIDSANLDEIRRASDLGILDGVTTNPSLMAKEGIRGKSIVIQHYKRICNIVRDNVSAEVIAVELKEIIKEGEELAAIDKKIIVKVPMTEAGIKAIVYFYEKKIRTNCTLVFSVGQAILAAKAGASYISPFIGRLDDIYSNGIELIKKMMFTFKACNFHTEILAASIRHAMHLAACAKLGVNAITCPLNVILGLLKHPLTDIGVERFLVDSKKME